MTVILLGSKNPVKRQALVETLAELAPFSDPEVRGVAVSSGVSDQPIGFEPTITGARNRARAAFEVGADLGVGIESGLVPVPMTRTGFLNQTCCVLFDGSAFHMGLGPAFELPKDVATGVFDRGMELDDAVKAAGLTASARVGYGEGLIGILTGNVMTRMRYTKPAIFMAFAAQNGA